MKKLTLSRSTMQYGVAGVVIALGMVAVIVAAVDGNNMLKAVAPMVSLVLGWLFASQVFTISDAAPNEAT